MTDEFVERRAGSRSAELGHAELHAKLDRLTADLQQHIADESADLHTVVEWIHGGKVAMRILSAVLGALVAIAGLAAWLKDNVTWK